MQFFRLPEQKNPCVQRRFEAEQEKNGQNGTRGSKKAVSETRQRRQGGVPAVIF